MRASDRSACHLHPGDRDQADAGIGHLGGQNLADFLADLLGDAFDAMGERHDFDGAYGAWSAYGA